MIHTNNPPQPAALLLCTDMDRTIIPNGKAAEEPTARQRFSHFCAHPAVDLVYVTGRCRQLAEAAITEYQLPRPDYLISDVGTKIYQAHKTAWHPLSSWQQQLDQDWQAHNWQSISHLLRELPALQLQEESKQNQHKLSYYLALPCDPAPLLDEIKTRLTAANIATTLVWSIDEMKQVGLLDILPRSAGKSATIHFLARHLNCPLEQLLFAGDSGNDLDVMGDAIASVLVANADPSVKAQAQRLAAANQQAASLYLAKGQYLGMNGNYAAGVLEGVFHFAAHFRPTLEAL